MNAPTHPPAPVTEPRNEWLSCAKWKDGLLSFAYGNHDNTTRDRHDTKAQAEAVCKRLEREGLGGERIHFPVKTWVEEAPATVATPWEKSPTPPPVPVPASRSQERRFAAQGVKPEGTPVEPKLWEIHLHSGDTLVRRLCQECERLCRELDNEKAAAVEENARFNHALQAAQEQRQRAESLAEKVKLHDGVFMAYHQERERLKADLATARKREKGLREACQAGEKIITDFFTYINEGSMESAVFTMKAIRDKLTCAVLAATATATTGKDGAA